MYSGATVVLCKCHSEQPLRSTIQQDLDRLHAGVVGAWWCDVSYVVACLILLEYQDTLFARYPNLQLTFVHTVQCCYIYYMVICPIY